MRIKVYGTRECPDTRECLAAYEEKKLDFEFVDISRLDSLKAFLAIRDKDPLYDPIRAAGRVGIPLVESGERRTLDWESLL